MYSSTSSNASQNWAMTLKSAVPPSIMLRDFEVVGNGTLATGLKTNPQYIGNKLLNNNIHSMGYTTCERGAGIGVCVRALP